VIKEAIMETKKFIFILNHSFDNPDKAAGALQLAANMKAFDIELDFFLINEGVLLSKKDFAHTITWQKKDGFSPLGQLLTTLTEDFGVRFYVCAACVKPYGLEDAKLIRNAEIKPGSFLAEILMDRQSLTF
jgi:predicted peroxiredoxin